jgi:transcriptional regulator with XRE-family HTH domain
MVALGRVLALLRNTQGLKQSDVAKRAGTKRSSISQYERGERAPDSSILEQILSALGLRWAALDLGKWFLDRLEADSRITGDESPAGGTPPSLGPAAALTDRLHADLAVAHQTAAALGQMVAILDDRDDERLTFPSFPSIVLEGRRNDERSAAKRQWARIKAIPAKEQAKALRAVPADVQWALCEILCIDSQRLCGHDPISAAALAELALASANLASCDDAFRAKLQALAHAHIGNVWRARGDLQAAEDALTLAEALWETGKDAEHGLVEEGLIFLSKASLRRTQCRFDETAELLDRAERMAIGPTFLVQVQVSRAKLLDDRGYLEEAVAILERVSESVSPDEDPRILLMVWQNLTDNLSKLERFSEAAGLLPEVRRYWQATGSGALNLVRLSWTEARILAGLGSVEEGLEILARVRGEFSARSMAYDMALVSLELAVAYAAEGRDDQVKVIARHMAPIFQAQEVHREVLATLTLFRQAAERERVTTAFAQDVLTYLRKARHEPGLRFERRASEKQDSEQPAGTSDE